MTLKKKDKYYADISEEIKADRNSESFYLH